MAGMSNITASARALWYGTPDGTPARTQQKRSPWVAAVVALVVVGLIAVFVVTRLQASAASERRSDEYYCTLDGIGPMDRAPNTNERCIDLLG